jgi:NAD(P)-dependent dehydrogenase (short-subunit alcohol dehydrogenase family)
VNAGRLAGRVALVTGAASGLGAATARRFVAEGARVLVADLQEDRGRALVAELGAASRFVTTDVTEEAAIAAAVDEAVSTFGALDLMFNNAGIIGALGPIAGLQSADFDYTVAVNLRSVAFGMKHAARVMVPRGRGVILSTTSPAAVAGGLGPHVYSATKGAVISLTMSVAAELRPHGIRVNAIMPGAMVTAMTADITTGDPDDLDQARETMGRSALMSRPGLPDDIAAAAVYLASDDAAYVTATVLPVDAGLTGAPGTSPFAEAAFVGAALMREGGRRGVERSGPP